MHSNRATPCNEIPDKRGTALAQFQLGGKALGNGTHNPDQSGNKTSVTAEETRVYPRYRLTGCSMTMRSEEFY